MKHEPLDLEKLAEVIVRIDYPDIKQFSHLQQYLILIKRLIIF